MLKLAFNLISVSKLIIDLNSYISFFPDHACFVILRHKVIGKGHMFDYLYIFNKYEPRFVVCTSVMASFEATLRDIILYFS